MTLLNQSLTLPCGAVLPNRLCKAAMTEGLADIEGLPTKALDNLYGIWSDGGAGLLLSGNIQVDGDHLERPGNVIIESTPDEKMKVALARWAKSATRNGNQFWAQISHAGRQTQTNINKTPKAPSAVKLGLPGGQFGMPVPLVISEIEDIILRFANTAKTVVDAGFTGVQIHAAHGYLVSQFLSPRSNKRTDEYGGELKNRARFLLAIVKAVRIALGPKIPVAVKLNSADFQKGGFDFDDSLQVVQWLEEAGVDLVEISGGTYEQPKLLGLEGLEKEEEQTVARSTSMREAYFVDFSKAMQKHVNIPLMVTGGFRQRAVMEKALEEGSADVIGLGRPMCVETDAPNKLLAGSAELPRYEDQLKLLPNWLSFLTKINMIRSMSAFATQFWYYAQIDALGHKGKTEPETTVFQATKKVMSDQKEWLSQRARLSTRE